MSQLQLLRGLHKDLLQFFDSLIDAFPEEGELVIIRFALTDQFPITDIMDYIILSLLPLKSKVVNRDNNFFLENNILFESLESSKVNHFKRIWKSDSMNEEDRESIWKWFDRFLLRAERYQKCLTSK